MWFHRHFNATIPSPINYLINCLVIVKLTICTTGGGVKADWAGQGGGRDGGRSL